MSTNAFTPRLAALLACFAILFLNGCGSGNDGGAALTGRVSVRIEWPPKTTRDASGRYLPSYASSIFFELYPKNAPTSRYSLIVNRPAEKPSSQTVSFSQVLNEGDYVLAASARVGADGQGASVASAVVPVAVKQGMNPVDLALTSTIKTIQILGQPLTVQVGPDVALQSGAFDPDGRTLLLPSNALTWSVVSGGQFGSLTPAGVLSPKAAGTIRVKLSEAGAGVSSEADVVIATQTVTVALGATPYPKEYADLSNTGLVSGKGSLGKFAWTYDLGASTGFYTTTPIIGGNGLVYGMSIASGTTSATAVGIRTSDGTKAWQVSLQGFNPYSPVALSTNLICIPLNNVGLVALDAATGIERWRNSSVNSVSPATVDRSGHILVGARDGVHVLDPSNGADIAVFPGTNCSFPAVGQDGTVYYVRQLSGNSADGELVSGNPTTHASNWTVKQIETGHTPVIGPNGSIYTIGSQTGTAFTRLVRVDAASGNVISEIRNQFFSFSQDPAFGADGNLYVGQGDKVTAYDANLIQLRQTAAISVGGNFYSTRRITIGSDSTLYVVADQNSPESDSKLIAYNTTDLSKKWEYALTGRVLGSISIDSDGTVYFLTDTGKVVALR